MPSLPYLFMIWQYKQVGLCNSVNNMVLWRCLHVMRVEEGVWPYLCVGLFFCALWRLLTALLLLLLLLVVLSNL